jgi:hypothetical protein
MPLLEEENIVVRLEIQAVGTNDYPRFIIVRSDGQVFDGTGWTQDRSRAVWFNEGVALALQFNALQEAMFKNMPLVEFTVALNIRVRAGEPFTKQQLAEYLERATSIMLDHDKGTGPVKNSMVQLDVTWAGLAEKCVTNKEQ